MDIKDTCCVLCDQECETSSHLFIKCPVAKALWFSVCWGLRSDELHLSTSADIIKLILKPPSALCQAQDRWLVSLNMALPLRRFGVLAMLCFTRKERWTYSRLFKLSTPRFMNAISSSPKRSMLIQILPLQTGLLHLQELSRLTSMRRSPLLTQL